MSQPVIIVDYDPVWPHRYENERVLLARVLHDRSVAIEHIGSTAVPGLAAKPIIDIMVGVAELEEIEGRISDLEKHDYKYMPEYEVQLPDRRFFHKPREGHRTYHLHCVVQDSSFWCRHIAFRDYLCSHPETARSYHALKRSLARQYRSNRESYTRGKNDFIQATLDKAGADGVG